MLNPKISNKTLLFFTIGYFCLVNAKIVTQTIIAASPASEKEKSIDEHIDENSEVGEEIDEHELLKNVSLSCCTMKIFFRSNTS